DQCQQLYGVGGQTADRQPEDPLLEARVRSDRGERNRRDQVVGEDGGGQQQQAGQQQSTAAGGQLGHALEARPTQDEHAAGQPQGTQDQAHQDARQKRARY